MKTVPVIDLFAGPGGLGEGFAAFQTTDGRQPFKIALSIEKDPYAHQTLTLRSFFRQFTPEAAPEEYYTYLRSPYEAIIWVMRFFPNRGCYAY
jgi:DNA (cytosine-5)-methyltransferase 1